ncbi:uncharacterized protein JN550_007805 [Neoarthrinium moseri]|uniref:uncharacterized protein n=1 Tax=Neoarthrinium moseri TaxID=1658444 RepID=UPI001FDCC772|nr:uncharacterized protein JN550_007805 [Neoarthrinium moseri]KAI1866116.1 hypothetical protein JN550_007805 [Neoarthrinium moseri]
MAYSEPDWLLVSLHYVYPAAVFLYFATAYAIAACTLQTASTAVKTKHGRPKIITCLLLAFLLSYLVQLAEKLIEGALSLEWPSEDTVVGLLSCMLVFGIEQSTLGNAVDVVWYPFYGSWLIGVVLEPVLAVLSILQRCRGRRIEVSEIANSTVFLWIDVAIFITRYLILLAVILVFFLWREKNELEGADDETSPLLPKPDQTAANGNGTDSGYGTRENSANNTDATNSPSDPESPWERRQRLAREQMEKRLKSEGSWIAYAKGFLIFFPYVWPVHNRRLQLYAALVGVCLITGNALNVLIPRQMGIVLDSLSGDAKGLNPWIQVLIFAALRLAASEAGIHLLRQMFWLPVEFYSQEALSVAAYNHVMNLSADFHDSKSSSDLIVAISHGTSISRMLESICFEALPMMIDLVVAFIYLSVKFGPYEGFITIATGIAFVQAATYLIARFKEKRKQMVKTFFEEHYVRQAGIQGWHTVSAFNQIPYEESRYQTAVRSEISAYKGLYSGYLIGHAFQYLILLCGLIAGAFLAVHQVTHGQRTPGDFVMLLTYWGQLTSPLRFFSNLGKSISQDLVYAERLLGVMLTKPTIVNKPDAKPLDLKGGEITFRDVSFSYDKKKDILKGVNLTVPSGKTAAFVGATGAGKSTILKLLDRFYDVSEGCIGIDGQDIRDVQISSLRQSIGIVPQAPILFDDTIMSNIRYARLTASDEEVHEACKAAAIHDHIMGFSDGYQTRVGERGVKISGGELQRIAIARAILKRPEVVLLDEATSSVDTETEQKIQEGLRVLCEARTTFIVAHRLSTVMNADVIFVVSDGEIVEQGSHEELLEKKGKYSELWSKQIFVKPKEDKGLLVTNDIINEPPRTQTQTQTQETSENANAKDGNADAASEPTKTQATKLNRPVTTPKLVTSSLAANEQSVKTPSGHQKEGSRLNPGAPVFTPRSAAADQRTTDETLQECQQPTAKTDARASPTRNTWADEVEVGVHFPPMPKSGMNTTKENTKPVDQSPRKTPLAAGYRRFEPQDSSRSVSDPVPSTPEKRVSNQQNDSVDQHTEQSVGEALQPRTRGKRTTSRGRGGNSRGRGGRQPGSRGRGGGRSASGPSHQAPA